MSQIIAADKKCETASNMKDVREQLLVLPSPSLTWATHGGIPRGKITNFYGPEGSSKTTLALIALAQIQKNDPDAIGIWFDAEFNFSPVWARTQGVDTDRLIVRVGNNGSEIFDFISKTVKAMCQEGAPIKFIGLDSVKSLVPPKEAGQESTGNHQIGDLSKFLNIAIRSVIETIHENVITAIFINQANINMDPHTGKYQPYIQAGGQALKHGSSLICLIEKINSKDSLIIDETSQNMNDTQEVLGKKIRVKVVKTRSGGEGRVAEFTLHFEKGIVNIGEEVARLGVNQGVITRPNNRTYVLPNKKSLTGAANLVKHLDENPEDQQEIMDAIYSKKNPIIEEIDA